jgi:hypothetical protein
MEAVMGSKPGALLMIADPTTCAAAYKAAQTLSFSAPIYNPLECQSPANGQLTSQLSQQVHLQQTFVSLSSTSDPDAVAYNKAMAAYGASATSTSSGYAINAFQTIMDLYAGLKAASASGTPTSSGLVHALETDKLHQFLLGPDASFTCDGKLEPSLPALCSLNTLFGLWKGSAVTDIKAVNAAQFLAP